MSPSMSDMEPPQAVHADETAKSKAAASDSTVTVIKTDKPRPHVCGTCARSFARLEHLKRHERSHTKEKPFQCPECTRCFARRDLLLRHQQKLHLTATPSRPRNGRRESTSSVANSSRVRKNSAANSAANPSSNASMRPRANTISHVDNTTLGMIAAANASVARKQNQPTHSRHPSLTNLPSSIPWSMPMGLGHHDHPHGLSNGLPKLDTNGLNIDIGGGLRTAPPYAGMGNEFDFEGFLAGPGSTVNPAQLHMSDSSHPLSMNSQSPFTQGFPNFSNPSMEEDDNFDWMTTGFDTQLNFGGLSDPNVDGSSPSAFSTASQSGVSEVMLDGSNYQMQQPSGNIWQQNGMIMPGPIITNMDFVGPEMQDMPAPPGTISPKSLHGQSMGNDPLFGIPPGLATMSPGAMGMQGQFMHNGMGFHPETPSTSSVSASGSARQSSVTSVSTGVITDATRQALLTSLSQPSVFGHNHRKYSQPSISSPLSPAFSQRTGSFSASLPSTYDLQRYITAYIDYFHPHMPFLHIPTLDFNSASTFSARPTSGYGDVSHSALHGGSGCLILAMAAIGALYEYEIGASKDLFEAAKKMIQLYLEERRKADLSAALNGTNGGHENSIQNTPLWLVQAMLLNVIYGHNCGDKTAADIASTHCAALVSLARAAELTRPVTPGSTPQTTSQHVKMEDLQISDNMVTEQNWNMYEDSIEEQWQHWKVKEERKRTLYAVFILSSMLVMAYNHTPALTNSEIRLDLPCDEDLWSAESAHNWYSRGGAQVAEQKCLPFATALSTLLTASQRQQQFPFGHFANNMMMDELPDSDVKPSALGCLILIYALHNYIWETRQRHLGRPWTHQETEAMHAHVEPALKAWQAAWASDPRHSAERPNPSGLGPLSADSIPLLDLAYVRLYVNLGRSKEAFWQRDFDGMADELARGSDVVQQTETSPSSGSSSEPPDSLHSSNASSMSPLTATSSPDMKPLTSPMMNQGMAPPVRTPPHPSYSSSKRERHLRKAAFYAANSLAMADKLGVSYADFTCRELPLQCAMAAFDCAQVLAEWVSTVQERVGRYLGILGKDDIDYGQVPGIMLLDDEDCRLLDKIVEVLNGAEAKVALDMGGTGPIGPAAALKECGFGSKILLMTAYMLDKAAVWPVTRLMARSLETQALHMTTRADYSVSNRE